jgi:hypothetical protein
VLRLIALQPEITLSSEPAVLCIRDRWLVASGADFNGCVPVDLNSAIATTAGRVAVLQAAASLERRLRECCGPLHKDTLNLLGLPGSYIQDCDVAVLCECVKKALGLIENYTPTGIQS